MPYSERAQNTRDSLRAVTEEHAAKRRRFIESLDHSSMTALALSAAARKKEEADAAEAARLADIDEMRREWTTGYMRRVPPVVTARFAESMGLDADSPLLAELMWRLDPDKHASLTFEREADGHVVARAADGERDAFSLLADIDALTIMANPYVDKESGEITMVIFSAEHGSVSRGIGGDLAALGEEIEKARRRAASDNGEAG